MRSLDAIDWSILEALQDDARLSFRELAKRVHLSAPATTARVHALERDGVITGYRAVVDPTVAGRPIEAFVRLTTTTTTNRSVGAIEDVARRHSGVLEVHQVLGDCDVVLRVALPTLAELDALVTELGDFGQTTTTVIASSPVARRALEPVAPDAPDALDAPVAGDPSVRGQGAPQA